MKIFFKKIINHIFKEPHHYNAKRILDEHFLENKSKDITNEKKEDK